jgi:hypothetical protein
MATYDNRAAQIKRQQMIADALRASGNEGVNYAPPSGNRAYRHSSWEGVNEILQQLTGAYLGNRATKDQSALEQQDQANTKQLIDSARSVEDQGFVRPITDVAGTPNPAAMAQNQNLDTDRTAAMRAAALRGVQFGGTAAPLAGEMLSRDLFPSQKEVKYQDLGDRIVSIGPNGEIIGSLPKGTTPDASASRAAAEAARLQAQEQHQADQLHSDQQNQLGRESSAANSQRSNDITTRGQDRLDVRSLRDDRNNQLQQLGYPAIQSGYSRVKQAASDPSAAGDIALIFGYMKILDPTSVVREGEFATAQNAGSAFNRIGALYNSVMQGQRLTAAQRADFAKQAGGAYAQAKARKDAIDNSYRGIAKRNGYNPDDILVDLNDNPPIGAASGLPPGFVVDK